MFRAVAIIPARFGSTRFPGKPLALLKGKPVIQHVYQAVSSAGLIDAVFVATDDRRIFDLVRGFGGRAVMTSTEHTCGTERIAEVAEDIECDIIVNVQGDEPFIKPEMVDDVIKVLSDDRRAEISTLAKKTHDIKEILSPDVVKVVFDNEGFAMYFSRAPIPFYRDKPTSDLQAPHYYKHIGIYGYKKDVLLRFASMPQGRLELIERLEQLRALTGGIKMKVKETPYDTFGIDTPEDLERAEEWLNLSL